MNEKELNGWTVIGVAILTIGIVALIFWGLHKITKKIEWSNEPTPAQQNVPVITPGDEKGA